MTTETTPAPVEVKGGFDGFVLSFGDGVNTNSLNTILAVVAKYTSEITLTSGETIVGGEGHFETDDDGNTVLITRVFNDEIGECGTETRTIDFADIVAVDVY